MKNNQFIKLQKLKESISKNQILEREIERKKIEEMEKRK